MLRTDLIPLISRLKASYTNDLVLESIAEHPDQDSFVHFNIKRLPVSFSVLCDRPDIHPGIYNYQVESEPQGDYVYADETDLDGIFELIELYRESSEKLP